MKIGLFRLTGDKIINLRRKPLKTKNLENMNTFPLNMQSMPMPGMNNIPMQPQTRNASGPGQPNSTLYVGNLDSDLDEQRLYEYFSHYGPVNNVRIMRDLYSGESRGFAFVNYAQAVDAKRAKLVLNHTKVQDNEIRISFKRNPADIDQKANLYISNLDTKCGSRELEEMCAEHGLVVSCIVREDARGGSLGYGYVQFENEKGAQACIQGLNGQKLYEKEISVQVFVPRSKRTSPIQRNNLYLKNFPVSFTEEQVKEFINKSFSEFGSIESVGIFLDAKTNRHYAFVAFKQGEEARNAVQGLNGHDFGEDKLYVDFAQQKGQRRKMLKQKHMKYKNETNLYIRSLKPGVTEAQFRAAFEKYGTINSICLKKHSFPQRSQQQQETPEDKELAFGFVNFPNVEEAKNAFTEGKKDQDILDLIDESHNEKTEFIFYAQPAGMRKQYLRMIKKNFKATQMMQNNLLMMTQNAMKFMRMNNGGKNNFRPQGGNRGPKFSGKRGMRDNNMMGNMPFMGGMPPMNPMNMMMNNMGMNPQMQVLISPPPYLEF